MQWSKEQLDILTTIEKHKNANANYFDQGIKILELTQKLYSVYFQKDSKEKGQLVKLLLSNCTLNDGNLCPTYKKLFNLLVEEPSRLLWWRLVDDFRNFCMNDETEKIYQKLEETIGIC